MQHEIFQPPQHLKSYIRYYWIIDYPGSPATPHILDIYADLYPRMVIQHHNGNSAFLAKEGMMPVSYLSGIKTGPIQFSVRSSSILIVSFYPAALRVLFGTDADELINLHPELHDFAPKSFTDQVLEAANATAKIALLNHFFTSKLLQGKVKTDTLFVEALGRFYAAKSENSIGSFLKESGTSERQLQRSFKANVGITPKQFLRILRFEKSLALLKNNKSELNDLAFTMEYFDQSHFIREFKEFSGTTPYRFMGKYIISGEGNAVLTDG